MQALINFPVDDHLLRHLEYYFPCTNGNVPTLTNFQQLYRLLKLYSLFI